jgi:hypothetical protein
MKHILILTLILACCELCPAQSKYPFTSESKTITTTVDTVKANTTIYQSYELWVYNHPISSDTLLWWTDIDTNKHVLPPGRASYREHIYLSKLFRKAKNSSVTSDASGN